MEKRKNSLSAVRMCRFCLTQNESLRSLYDRNRTPKSSVNLNLKILSCVSVEVYPSDQRPTFICDRCRYFMSLFYDYKQIVRQADETILQYLQHGSPMEIITWPTSLTNVLQRKVVKTVVEGGATVQVTSQDNSDSDDDEGNVYNVKIGDMPDETSTACVKVVTSKEDKDVEDSNTRGKGFVSIAKLARHVRSHAGDRPYPCKFCDKSFTKSHHYTRHLRLKHNEGAGARRRSADSFRCEQCEDTFSSQDDLIYHSAIHATQNLTCPLCQEKFADVDAVTTHIKSHVNGVEFMCDFCELVFTTKEKLDNHLIIAHEDEMHDAMSPDESSMENQEEEDDEEDNDINVKDEGDHMLIEIKKPNEFLIDNTKEDTEEKPEITNSEESETETTFAELSTVNAVAIINKEVPVVQEKPAAKPVAAPVIAEPIKAAVAKESKPTDNQTASILRKAEEMKRKAVQQTLDTAVEKKEKPVTKVETTNTGGASDKSLRLLEKELQDLKRTNSRTEIIKNTPKSLEPIRNKRPQVHTSTPKLSKIMSNRMTEEKKLPFRNKSPALDKKQPEKRAITKENKEPKESKEIKNNNGNSKEQKEKDTDKEKDKDVKDKDVKEKETPKSVIKNGPNSDKSNSEEGIRRSTRPSKIKNYAKMIRDRIQVEDNDDTSEDDEDYEECDRSLESRLKARRSSQTSKPAKQVKKPPVTVQGATQPTPRKRGRPRKEVPKEVPAKIRKENNEEAVDVKKENTSELENTAIKMETDSSNSVNDNNKNVNKATQEQKPTPSDVLVSPSGQTLKKVPIKALPPGVKPLPLPVNARPMQTGELCEMQIGKKLVKVQKIVMTKAEVEAMAKKGLVEMKDGTMVLKQGIKLPAADPAAIKSSLVGEGESEKESAIKSEKAIPTRCDLGEDS